MKKADISIKRSTSLYNLIIVAIGIGGMVLAFTFDFIKNREVNFGMDQMAGIVISVIMALSGLRRLQFVRPNLLHGLLLAAYFAGVLFMGLKTRDHSGYHTAGPLQDMGVFSGDVAMNFLGFIPLGYLMVAYLFTSSARQTHFLLLFAICLCIGTSFFIELTQFYLPGRTSSFIDFLANGAGALCGIAYGFLEHKFLLVEACIRKGRNDQSKRTRRPILNPKS